MTQHNMPSWFLQLDTGLWKVNDAKEGLQVFVKVYEKGEPVVSANHAMLQLLMMHPDDAKEMETAHKRNGATELKHANAYQMYRVVVTKHDFYKCGETAKKMNIGPGVRACSARWPFDQKIYGGYASLSRHPVNSNYVYVYFNDGDCAFIHFSDIKYHDMLHVKVKRKRVKNFWCDPEYLSTQKPKNIFRMMH